jgi:hypothetical protein
MKKQTAVEWLAEKLRIEFGFAFSNNILEQAKEMGRGQIEEAFYNARKNKSDCQIWNCEGSQKAYETFNEYYTETFNP